MESTTRYRNKCAGKKITRSRDKLPQRMRSGARGGRAAKRSAKQRADQRSFEHSKNSDRLLQVRADKQPSPSEAGISSRLPYASPPGVPGSPITPVLEGQHASRGSKLVKEEGMDSNLISGIDRLQSTASAGNGKCEPLIEQPEEVWPGDPYLTEMLSMQHAHGWSETKPLNT